MKWYTEKHLWLEEKDDGTLEVGITSQGDDLMGGIQYAGVADGMIEVESVKSYEQIEVPVTGVLHGIEAVHMVPALNDHWDESKVIGWYDRGYVVDAAKVMDRKAYLKMCFGETCDTSDL